MSRSNNWYTGNYSCSWSTQKGQVFIWTSDSSRIRLQKKRIHSIRKLPSSSALRYSGQAQDS